MSREECFLCGAEGKARMVRFYSGVKKGGTTHKMLSCTVTIFERWSDLTMHEIHVCKACQVRLWRAKHATPMMLFAIGAAVLLMMALVTGLVFWGADFFVVPGLLTVAALGMGGLFGYHLTQHQQEKPKNSLVEPLVVREAADKMPYDDHTFMTAEQYIERHRAGIIG